MMILQIRKRMAWLPALIVIALVLGGITAVLGDAGARLFVVNTLSEELSIFDMAADRSLDSIPLGERGYRVAFSPDGKTAYVTASPEVMMDRPMSPAGTVRTAQAPGLLIIDLVKGRVAVQIPMAISPLANVHVNSNGRQAYVVTAGPQGARNIERGRVLVVDLPHRKVARTINIGLNPLDSVLMKDGKTLFSADWGSRSISVVDLAEGRLTDSIPLGMSATRMLAAHPDGQALYAVLETPFFGFNAAQSNLNALSQTAQQNMSVIGVGTMLAEIDTGARTVTPLPIDGLGTITAIAVAPKGERLYAYGTVPAAPTNARQAPAQVQQQAVPRVQADAYAVSVIDLKKRTVTQRFEATGYLSAMAVSPDGGKLYLIGAPGDPAKEAEIQRRVAARMRNNDGQHRQVQSKDGANTQMAKNGASMQDFNNSAVNATADEAINDILRDLSQLPKTLVVLDANTGQRLKTLPLGSLPQGYGVKGR